MALCGCSSGLVVTAVVALLLLPVQYYVPDLYSSHDDPLATEEQADSGFTWPDLVISTYPPLDIFVTSSLVFLGFFTYICEWIQRKLMEGRIEKLNQYLSMGLERLRTWDEQQQQQEATLKMVQNATSEYNLLLYLLLRQHRCLAAHAGADRSKCAAGPCAHKNITDDLDFLRNVKFDT